MELQNFRFVGVNYMRPAGTIDVYWSFKGEEKACRVMMHELLQFYQDNPIGWYDKLDGAYNWELTTHSFDFIIISYDHFIEFLKAFIIKNHYGTE